MFHVTRIGDNRIDVDFSGKLDSNEMRFALDELMRKSEGISHGQMLYRIGDFDLPTLGAVGVELSRIPQLFRFIRRFDRCAVVAGKEWVRRASEIEGALIPGLTIKAFDLHEAERAHQWLEAQP
nr:STAS/SEC14 domain-containing protein [Pseudomonas sp.]